MGGEEDAERRRRRRSRSRSRRSYIEDRAERARKVHQLPVYSSTAINLVMYHTDPARLACGEESDCETKATGSVARIEKSSSVIQSHFSSFHSFFSSFFHLRWIISFKQNAKEDEERPLFSLQSASVLQNASSTAPRSFICTFFHASGRSTSCVDQASIALAWGRDGRSAQSRGGI